jgi:hypothetical protein
MRDKPKKQNPIEELFGKPALLAGEDEELYSRLRNAVASHINPETTLDWILADDLAGKHWEEQRLKRDAAALLDGVYDEAVRILVAPFLAPSEQPKLPYFITYTRLHGDDFDKGTMAQTLAHFGITKQQIRAKQFQICGSDLTVIDRMIARRESSRRHMDKQLERSAKKNSKAPRLNKN